MKFKVTVIHTLEAKSMEEAEGLFVDTQSKIDSLLPPEFEFQHATIDPIQEKLSIVRDENPEEGE